MDKALAFVTSCRVLAPAISFLNSLDASRLGLDNFSSASSGELLSFNAVAGRRAPHHQPCRQLSSLVPLAQRVNMSYQLCSE